MKNSRHPESHQLNKLLRGNQKQDIKIITFVQIIQLIIQFPYNFKNIQLIVSLFFSCRSCITENIYGLIFFTFFCFYCSKANFIFLCLEILIQISTFINNIMINLAYLVFFYILIAEVILFLLITLPTPAGFKSKVVRSFMGSGLRSSLMWVHLALCILAGLFFLDLAQTEVNYVTEKDRLRSLGNGHVGTEVRMGFLSYQIQRVQRNKYITAMLIYASIVLNLYVRMLYFIYKRRGDYDSVPETAGKQVVSPTTRTSTVTRVSSKTEQNKVK